MPLRFDPLSPALGARCGSGARRVPGGAETFLSMQPFPGVPHFYLDILDGDQVIEDSERIAFPDLQTALAEAVQGARGLVAHGILENEDVSGHTFLIRDEQGEVVATLPFRETLPGRLRS